MAQKPASKSAALPPQAANDFVTVRVDNQLFGIPVLQVQDVQRNPTLTAVPLAPPEIAGLLNLRGRIVTAVCVRTRLNRPKQPADAPFMGIVVEHGRELYCLVVDAVGDVRRLGPETYERNPPTLDPRWRDMVDGVHRLEDELLLVLEKRRLLALPGAPAEQAA